MRLRDAALGFGVAVLQALSLSTASAIEAPTGVVFDEIEPTKITASAYAPTPAFSGLNAAQAGTAVAIDRGSGFTYEPYHSPGDVWTSRAPMPTRRFNLALGVAGGKIYALGGNRSGAFLDVNEEYDPVVNTWATKARMPTPRQLLAAGGVGGKVYAVGGYVSQTAGMSVNEEYDPSSNAWTTRAAMPTARNRIPAVVIDGQLYVIGGKTSAELNNNESYDPATNTWAIRRAMPTARFTLGLAAVGGKVYAIGGTNSSVRYAVNEEFDPASNTWTTRAQMPTPRYELAAAATGGKIYAMGGYDGPAIAANEEYDPGTNTWVARAPMSLGRYGPSATAVGGKIYLLGGHDNLVYLDNNDEYDPGVATTFSGLLPDTLYSFKAKARDADGIVTAESPVFSIRTLPAAIEAPTGVVFDEIEPTKITASAYAPAPAFTNLSEGLSGTSLALDGIYADWHSGDKWASKANMPTARYAGVGAASGGLFFVFGGHQGGGSLAVVESYDPAGNVWFTRAPMPTARIGAVAVAAAGRIYVLGGNGGSNVNEEYDRASNTWQTRAPMPTAREGFAGAQVDGKIYAIGGNGSKNTNEQYDPMTDGWTTQAPMTTGRETLCAAAVGGKIYALGGFFHNENQAYDPATNSWAAKASLSSFRANPGCAVVGGKIFVAGGDSRSGAYVANMDEYDPAVDVWKARASMPGAGAGMAAAAVGGRMYVAGGWFGGFSNAVREYDPGVAQKFVGLTPDTLYSFKARARDADGVATAESLVFTVRTLALPTGGPVGTIWTGGAGDGLWSSASNWSTGQVPSAADDVTIDANVAVAASGSPISFKTLTLGHVSGNNSPRLVLSGSIASGGDVMIHKNATLEQATAAALSISGNLSLLAGAKLTHSANAASRAYVVNLSVGGDLSLALGASILADGLGIAGTVSGSCSDHSGGGGGHGGAGGSAYNRTNFLNNGGPVNDSPSYPSGLGRAGTGGTYCGGGSPGGSGGGAILLNVAGALSADGLISANGLNGANQGADWSGPGGGAGGTINIVVGSLNGTGTLQANGGKGGNGGSGGGGWGGGGGGGGGGRIALVVLGSNQSNLAMTAAGGAAGLRGTTLTPNPEAGRAGTISLASHLGQNTWLGTAGDGLWNTAGNWRAGSVPTAADDVVIDQNLSVAASGSPISFRSLALGDPGGSGSSRLVLSGGIASGGDVTIHKNAALEQATPSQLALASLTLRLGAKVTHTNNDAATDTSGPLYKVNLKTSGALTLESGSVIDAVGLGYKGGIFNVGPVGPGKGQPGSGIRSPVGGGGAGHGGKGGNGATSGSIFAGGGTYDSSSAPSDLGSGGGGPGTCTTGARGGNGGGLVLLEVGGTATIDGAINANGGAGTVSQGCSGGGGSGGTVRLQAATLAGVGLVGADGGAGGTSSAGSGGGGGGGRIAINVSGANTSSLAVTAAGGARGTGGQNTTNGDAGTTQAAVESSIQVNGTPELIFTAPVPVSAEPVPSAEGTGAVALGSAQGEGLSLISTLYLLGPENVVFNPPAVVTLHYDPAALGGIDPATLAIYDYNTETGQWVSLGGTVDTVNHSITVSVTQFSSIFAIMGSAPPVAWTGSAGDGQWNTAANWDSGSVPASDDAVVIDKTAVISAAGSPISFRTLALGKADGSVSPRLVLAASIASAGDVTVNKNAVLEQATAGPLSISGDLTLLAGSKLTHTANPAGASPTYRVNLQIGGALDLQANAAINVDGMGYPAGSGPAPGTTFTGAGHGGQGGAGGWPPPGPSYDSTVDPADLGSGGGPGSSGGGAVIISAQSMALNGLVTANGLTGPYPAGGGAGGTVNLSAASLSGNGTAQAKGGDRGSSNNGSGGGGRVAIKVSTSYSGSLNASAAAGATTLSFVNQGAPGTLYESYPAPIGARLSVAGNPAFISQGNAAVLGPGLDLNSLTISNAKVAFDANSVVNVAQAVSLSGTYGLTGGALNFPTAGMTSFTVPANSVLSASSLSADPSWAWTVNGSLTLGSMSAGSLTMSGSVSVDTLTVTGDLTMNSGALLAPKSARATAWRPAIGGNLTMAANSTINLAGMGFASVKGSAANNFNGRGGGPGGGTGLSGGGHGGAGGNGGNNFYQGGAANDDFTDPVLPGSAGGSVIDLGGAGGGALVLNLLGDAILNGLINASGGDGGSCAGSGAAGAINISARNISGSGTLRANGGNSHSNCSNAQGGGGGGLIALKPTTGLDATNLKFEVKSGLLNRGFGNNQAQDGGAGIVYLKSPSQANFDLVINGGSSPNQRANTPLPLPLTLDKLTLSGGVITPSGSQQALTVLESLSLSGSWGLTVGALSFPTAGLSSFSVPSVSSLTAASVPAGLSWNVDGLFDLAEPLLGQDLTVRGRAVLSAATLGGNLTTFKGALLSARAGNASGLTLDVGGSFDLASGSTITASGAGYKGVFGSAGSGPGGGGTGSLGGCGGGHGGAGGKAVIFNSVNCSGVGPVNDDAANPVLPGSAGGGVTGTFANTGGNGGGLVKIAADGAMFLNGIIEANGADGQTGISRSPGAGAGGAINISAGSLLGTGALRANGGIGALWDAVNAAGSGGGGRIAVNAPSCSLSLSTITADGGWVAGRNPQTFGGNGSISPLPGQPSLSGAAVSTSSVLWSWTAASNASGYQVMASTGGPVSPLLPSSSLSYLQSGLPAGSGVSNFVKALGCVASAVSASASATTHSLAESATFVNGSPELVFTAPVPVTAVLVPTAEGTGAVALATAQGEGLSLISNLYDLGPENTTFNPEATIILSYDPAALGGIDPATLAIYDYDTTTGQWVKLGGILDAANHTLTVTVASFSSIFAILRAPLQCGGVLSGNETLTADLNCPGTALTAGSGTVTLDCAGHKITYATSSTANNSYGIHAGGSPSLLVKNCVITQGSALNVFSHGIVLGSGGTVLGSTITTVNSNSDGIHVQGGNNSIIGNVISAGRNAVRIVNGSPGSANAVTSNVLRGGDAVVNVETGTDATISANTITGPATGTSGVYCAALRTTITGNAITAAGDGVVLASPGCSNAVVSDNTITQTATAFLPRNGLLVNNLDNAISNNTIIVLHPDGAGISLGLRGRGSSYYGMSETSRAIRNLIKDNSIAAPTGIYLSANNSGNTLYNNLINAAAPVGTASYTGSNVWSTAKQAGTNISGGAFLGGNYWINPSRTGFSESCRDLDQDRLCDEPHILTPRDADSLALAAPDTVPPTVFISSPAPNAAGWHNADVTVTFSGEDLESGIAFCSAPVTLGEGANQIVTGSCTDNAGHETSVTVTGINVDKTGPTVLISSPAANAAGWHDADVTVSFSGLDELSAIASCSAPVTLGEGAGQSAEGSCSDNAGNSTTASVTGINVDKTGPTVLISSPAANAAGWHKASVTVSFAGLDAGSGIASCSPPVTLSSDGAGQSASGSCTDRAGRSTSVTVTGINIDQTAPAVLISSPAANAAGWHNAAVTVSALGEDALSGIAGCTSAQLSAEGAGQTATVSCSDLAGNSDSAVVSGINIDLTAPVVLISSPAANAAGWHDADVTVSFSGLDELSAIASCSAPVTLGEGAGQSAAGSCSDNAGNTTTVSVTGINVDKTGPTVLISSPAPNAAGWHNASVTVSFSGQDSGSGIASCTAPVILDADGAGQSASGSCTDLSGRSTSVTAAGINIDKTSPVVLISSPAANAAGWHNSDVTVSFAGSDSGSGIASCTAPVTLGEGPSQSASGSCTDAAGNTASAGVTGINVDKTAPATALTTQGGSSFKQFGETYLTPDTLFVLTPTDALSGAKSTSYSIDAGLPQAYTAPFSLPEGTHTIGFSSDDAADNLEAAQSQTFNVGVFQSNGASAGKKKSIETSGTILYVGDLATNGAFTGSGNVTIQGSVTAPAITLTGQSRITGTRTLAEAPIHPSPFDLSAALSSVTASNRNADIASHLVNGVLTVRKANLVLPEGNYLLRGIDLSGGAVVGAAGKVGLFVQGPITLSGGARLNDDPNGDAEKLTIFSDSDAPITLSGGARLGALLYAPESVTTLTGNAQFGGHLFAGHLTMTGTAIAVKSGHSVPADPSKKNGTAESEAGTTALLAADATFVFRQLYAFPNPARREQKPTIRLQVGLADSVDLRIYDISGQLLHSASLDSPVILDDGNGSGPQYTYDHAWDTGGAGSGVYLYVISAKKSGSPDIRKSGKVAVIK